MNSRGILSVSLVGLLLVACSGRTETLQTTTVPDTLQSTTVPETLQPTTVPAAVVDVLPAVAAVGETIDASIVTADGRTRTYHVYIPAQLPDGPVPLLLALHGGTGWGLQFERTSGFDGLAEANGFLVVYPDGVGVGADGTELRTWNAGYCCGPSVTMQVDDVGFIRSLLDLIEAQYTVDPARVFAAGHSNGGMLSYRLACELSDRIVAVGIQSGSLGVETCSPDRPVSLMHVHGTADTNHPIDGGPGTTSISGVDYRSAAYSVETVAAAMGCASAPTLATDAVNADLAISSWTGCTDGAEVRLIAITGATHAWMGHPTPNPTAATPYQRFDSAVEILAFLWAHPRQ